MWRRHISSVLKPSSYIKKALKYSSQLASAKQPEDSVSDISSLKEGEKLHGFKVTDIQNVPDFKITAVSLVHEITKAQYLHLYRNDSNNVFSVSFRTTPMNDTGVPHILEHTVLCGSQKYPVRDPFFKMLNRSLATFMNAMTASDFTFYPFSTQNFSDYQNLQKIYCDAVFRPNLRLFDFMQEGWRLENENLQDKNSQLVIKGVVYNEMKGAFAENERILEQKIQNLILPDHTYGYISGGDPLKIPNLTWEDLKDFHKTHYHPSNARFYSYGNFPLIPTLKFLNTEYLSKYDYLDPIDTKIPEQTRWEQQKFEHVACRFENMRGSLEKQNFISISLLMTQITNTYDTFLLQFLSELLIKGPNAPFYKSMIEPNFSGGFTRTTGYDTYPKESIFTVGLQALDKAHFERVVSVFDKTIDRVIDEGFDEKHIESVLHRYELSIKHESANFGMNLLFGIIPVWNHDGPVVNSLKVNQLIDRLRAEIKSDPKYLQNEVQKYFKDNKHRLVLTMSAEKDYDKKQLDQEKELIKEKTKSLTNEDKEKIYQMCQELLKEQSAQQNIEILPTLQINDISSEVEKIPKEKAKVGPVPTQINKVNSNGITYFKGVLNTSDLSPEQQMLLPLFCYVINKLGTDKLNYREFDSLSSRKTSGLSLDVHIGDSLYQLHSYESGILVSSYCLDKNLDDMFDLWGQIFKISQLKDVDRFEMLVKLYMTDLTQGLADSGHLYAMQAAAGLVCGNDYQRDLLNGLQHISYMKRLVDTASYKAMLVEIVNIAKAVFDKNKLRCCLNITDTNKPKASESYQKFINTLPGNTFGTPNETTYSTTKVWTPTDSINCQHYVLNIPVNYCSKAVLTVPYTNPDFAKLRILSKLLSTKYLHPELREKGGAYGGGARLKEDGVFTFYSYRDPQTLKTLDVFDNSYTWLQKELEKVTAQELLEAKFGVFQAVDAPIPPGAKGCREFLIGLTPDVLQRHRSELMAVDFKGLREVGEKYLADKVASKCSKVVLGPKSEAFNTKGRPDELWTVVDA